MSNNCIFNDKRICSSCGECDVCELNSNKKCNNCGKCLELEGYDVKAIKIDEVFEDDGLDKAHDNIYDIDEVVLPDQKETSIENVLDEQIINEEDKLLLDAEELADLNKDGYIPENNEIWEFIDDIDGVKELLEDEEDNSEVLQEEFPGLIRLKKI